MAYVSTDNSHYGAIAAAIRDKGHEGTLKPAEMPSAILALVNPDGDCVYQPTVYNITPKVEAYRYTFFFNLYGYAQSVEITFEFEERTTQEYYLNSTSDVGVNPFKVFFDDSTSGTTITHMGYNQCIVNTPIPIGTKTVRVTFESYNDSYSTIVGLCIGAQPLTTSSREPDYWTRWLAIPPIPNNMTVTSTYNSTYVEADTIDESIPEIIEIEIRGYLDLGDVKIMDIEGGTY